MLFIVRKGNRQAAYMGKAKIMIIQYFKSTTDKHLCGLDVAEQSDEVEKRK